MAGGSTSRHHDPVVQWRWDFTSRKCRTIRDVDERGLDDVECGDFNGDGFVDIVRLKTLSLLDIDDHYGDVGTAQLETLTQTPQLGDRLETVMDEATVWPREQVTYSSQWSDKPEAVTACTYPQNCLKRGFPVVREVDSWDAVVNPKNAQALEPANVHQQFYSYEDPVSDMRGRGFLGFGKVRGGTRPNRARRSRCMTIERKWMASVTRERCGPAGHDHRTDSRR